MSSTTISMCNTIPVEIFVVDDDRHQTLLIPNRFNSLLNEDDEEEKKTEDVRNEEQFQHSLLQWYKYEVSTFSFGEEGGGGRAAWFLSHHDVVFVWVEIPDSVSSLLYLYK